MSRNRKGAQRRKKIRNIAGIVAAGWIAGPAGIAARAAAKKIIAKNRKKIEKFVVNEGGIQPAENLEELAVQAAQVRSKKIEEIKNDPNIEADTTEEAAEVFEEQQADDIENESYTGESDSFTEEAVGAILGVAKGVAKKIQARRAAKGKKNKFLNKLMGVKADTTGRGSVEISGISDEGSKDPLSAAIADAKQGTINTTVKQWLPIIIIAVVLGFLLMKKK